MAKTAALGALTALGDDTRRAVFESLRTGPRTVVEVARKMPVSRPAVSQHLKVLREAGLVTMRKEGRTSVYTVDPRGLAELRRYLESFWAGVLAEFKDAAERDHRSKRRHRRREGKA